MNFACRKTGMLALCLILNGCAYLHSLDNDLTPQINTWIESKDYGKALDTLYYIQPGHPQYKKLMQKKERIITLAAGFEADIRQQGMAHMDKNNWHLAYETFEYGLGKLPDSRVIRKAYDEFLVKRARYLKQLKLNLLRNKTRWLLSDISTREEIARVTPKNPPAKWRLQDHRLDIDSTSKTLIECIHDSIAANELDEARQCLEIARQLKPSPPLQQGIHDAAMALEREINLRSRTLSKQGQGILRAARLSVAKGDFHAAHQQIHKLPEGDKRNSEVLTFNNELNGLTADYVDKNIMDGRKLYSDGKVQEAYLLWKSLKPLAPENDRLRTLISRAEKVLNKLHKIGRSQEVVVPPGR